MIGKRLLEEYTMPEDQIQEFKIKPDPQSPADRVLVTNPGGSTINIHREDADPEHRFVEYRLAAGWFGNLPA